MATLRAGRSARRQHLPAALIAAAATGLLVLLPLQFGGPGRLAAVAVLQVALVLAWVPATGIAGAPGVQVLGVAAAAGADALVLIPEQPELGRLLAVPGLGFLAAVLHQMLRPASRDRVVGSLAGTLLLVCAVTALAVLLRLEPTGSGARPVVTTLLVIGATLVVGHVVDLLMPWPAIAPGVPRGVLGLVVGVLAGAAVAVFQHGAGELVEVLSVLTFGMLLGGIAALIGLAAGYAVAEHPGPVAAAAVVQVALPVAAGAPVALALVLQQAL